METFGKAEGTLPRKQSHSSDIQDSNDEGENIVIALHYLMREAKRVEHQDIYGALELALQFIESGEDALTTKLREKFANDEDAQACVQFLTAYLKAPRESREEFLANIEDMESFG